jgi:hypothetical protein
MWNAAVESDTRLYVTDDVSYALYTFDLTTQTLAPTGASVPPQTYALADGDSNNVWA